MKLVLRMPALLFYGVLVMQNSLFAMEKPREDLKDPVQFFAGMDPKAKNIKVITIAQAQWMEGFKEFENRACSGVLSQMTKK